MMEAKPPSEQKEYIQPDDDYAFHTYRILLLVRMCGMIKEPFFENYTLYGRGKFSFYDFLIRYPFYLKKIIEIEKKTNLLENLTLQEFETEQAFSPMIKYIRGPWDPKYTNILNYMVSKRLVIVHVSDYAKNQKAMCITLTPLGTNMAEQIMLKEKEWVERMEIINQVFGLDARNERIEKYIRKEFPELVLGIKGD
ncbi:hypothetical protein [Bacillus paranthracis]|uniref:hypothetical protein n=1 Tax=Bacillus paranthracis TaxID=2026186 RepID=UPI003D660A52